MDYTAILENRLRTLLAGRFGKPAYRRYTIIAVVVRLRYARAGRSAELGRYGSPLNAPRRPAPIEVGSLVSIGHYVCRVERVREHDAWVDVPNVGASWVPLADLVRG